MKINAGFLLFVLMTAVFASACTSSVPAQLIGPWRIDSVYDYYNGFSFTNRHPTPQEVHDYRKDSTVLRKGMGEQLLYRYSIKDSTLSIIAAGKKIDEFIILHVDDNLMVLKKNKKFLFPGSNQQRYEIRYFSRLSQR